MFEATWNVLFTVIPLALAFVAGWCLWRGLKEGRITAGTEGRDQTWLVRNEDPVQYWIVMLLLSLVVVVLCYGAAGPWVQG
jgi:hypothetical protein